MHVEMAIVASFDHAVGITTEQTQLDQAVHQHRQCRQVDLLAVHRTHRINGRLLGRQHKAVQIALLSAEAAVDRNVRVMSPL